MDSGEEQRPHIIGLTGSFGSGCSYVADKILGKLDGEYRYAGPGTPRPPAYQKLSLSDLVREEFNKEKGNNRSERHRQELQNFGDAVRLKNGPDYFAKQVISKICTSDADGPSIGWIVDSIRNPAEVHALREFSRGFFLFGIYADKETRWNRVKDKYDRDGKAFDRDDERDTGEDSPGHGQRVGDCFAEADIVISNNRHVKEVENEEFKRLARRVVEYAKLVSKPLAKQRSNRLNESLMAMAYAASQRSTCLKRRVGAVIVDEDGDVISSGFNDVPKHESPCKEEYRRCYRDWLCDKFFGSLSEKFAELKGREEVVQELFRGEFKILDYCRALHAEECAILNLTKNGRAVPLEKCVLYTTTYPCRQCANKIVTVGIKRIVYLEPYPDLAAKEILKGAEVKDEFFEGVTFKAYFRIYGEEK